MQPDAAALPSGGHADRLGFRDHGPGLHDVGLRLRATTRSNGLGIPDLSLTEVTQRSDPGGLPGLLGTECVYPVSYSPQGDNPKSMRADGPAADLVAALRKPSDPPWNGACVDGFRSISTFALVDDSGRAVIPFVPVDGCRIPQNGVYAALDALRFRPI